MIKYFCFLISIVCRMSTAFSQEFDGYIVSRDNNPVAYSSVYLSGKQTGITSDSVGRFRLPYSILDYRSDTLIVSCIGYASKKIAVNDFKKFLRDENNKIVLDREILMLKEVIIGASSGVSEDYGFFNLKSTNALLSGSPGARVCVFIENPDSTVKILQTVKIKVDKTSDKTKRLRLFFCSERDNKFIMNDLCKEDIIVSDFSKKNIIIDVGKYSIPFTKDGIYVGIEWISRENQLHDMSKEIGLSVKCTARHKKKSTWIYQNEKWEQFPPSTEEELKSIPEIFRNKIVNANAQIGVSAK